MLDNVSVGTGTDRVGFVRNLRRRLLLVVCNKIKGAILLVKLVVGVIKEECTQSENVTNAYIAVKVGIHSISKTNHFPFIHFEIEVQVSLLKVLYLVIYLI